MRERVDIYSQMQMRDAAGAISTTWNFVASCWARVKPLSANQIILAGRDEGVMTHMITVRYRRDISTNSRIVWRTRTLDVQGVRDTSEQRQFITVFVREIDGKAPIYTSTTTLLLDFGSGSSFLWP